MLYFDHNSTTALAPEVAGTLTAALRDVYGNASSTHRVGQMALQKLEEARRKIADARHVAPALIAAAGFPTLASNILSNAAPDIVRPDLTGAEMDAPNASAVMALGHSLAD